MQRYNITKVFIGGLLKGISIVETTSVKFPVGYVCRNPIGGSPYKITAVERLPFENS